LEHAVLVFLGGRNDGSLGSHGCQLRGNSISFSTPSLQLEVKIRTAGTQTYASKVSWNLL
jgi:hypothetical protein